MQMYIWTAPTPDRDGDLDNGIIIHEYGHGVSQPPDRRQRQLPRQRRADGRGLERLDDGHLHRDRQPHGDDQPRHRHLRPQSGDERPRHPAGAVHHRHDRQHLHLLQPGRRGRSARRRLHLEHDALGGVLGPRRGARLQPGPLRRLGERRQQPRHAAGHRRHEAPAVQPGLRRRPRRDSRRRPGAHRRRECLHHLGGVRQARPGLRRHPGRQHQHD